MRRTARYDEQRRSATVRARKMSCLGAALAAVGLLVAGCGGNSPSSGVARLGSSTSTTSSTAAGSAAGSSGGATGGEASPGSKAIAYASCIRAHGVPSFPDPQISTKAGGVSVRQAVPASIGVGNPKFKSAQQACRKLLPVGEGPNQTALSPQEQAQYLKAAACIRSHGVPNFPDPTFSGGGAHIDHQGLNESSPTFKSAVQACKSLIPGGLHGDG